MGKQRRKPRTYYQQIAAAVRYERKLNAKLIKVFRRYNKLYFRYSYNVDGTIWDTTLSKLENYKHNKYRTKSSSRKPTTRSRYSYTSWKEAGERSKSFVGYQCYIIECKGNNEQFYKIGKTFVDIHSRWQNLPYEYRVLKVFKGDAYYISKLEHKLHLLNINNKYKPKNKFSGITECFSKLEKETYAD